MSILTPDALARDLTTLDLTDPSSGDHVLQRLVDDAVAALVRLWCCRVRIVRAHPIVAVEDCYDRLGFDPAAITRDRRYTRYVSETCMLRSHTSASIPPELRRLARGGYVADVLLACPGIVYRRDSIDRLHAGTPHQLDLWRISGRRPYEPDDLDAMISEVLRSVLPGVRHRSVAAVHPYTVDGRQIDVWAAGEWIEVGECGIAAPSVLGAAGLDTGRVTGLAMGLGLDRVLMLRKGIPDIRLLRSTDPRTRAQMRDLEPYRAVSRQPAVQRDMSVAVDEAATPETLGDQVRAGLGADGASVEAVTVISETASAALPPAVAVRLGIGEGQKNVLLRVVLRDLDRTLTAAEANDLRDRIFAAVHRGAPGTGDETGAARVESGMMAASVSPTTGGSR